MKNLRITYASVLVILALSIITSCEEVIKLDLKNSDPQIVVEAVVTGEQQPFEVKLSKSTGFYDSSSYVKVTNAEVILTSSEGFADTLVDLGDGMYRGKEIQGQSGEEFTLTILSEGQIFTAKNTFPSQIELDSINYEWTENPRESGYMINMFFTDEPVVKNYYRVKVWVNNMFGQNQYFGPDYMLYEDKIIDGREAKLPAIRGGNLLHESDTVTVELYSISKQTFDYYNTVRSIVASDNSGRGAAQNMMSGSSAPANPVTNIDNGALGYFGAYSMSKKTIIIRPK